jgi:hypothetical protein
LAGRASNRGPLNSPNCQQQEASTFQCNHGRRAPGAGEVVSTPAGHYAAAIAAANADREFQYRRQYDHTLCLIKAADHGPEHIAVHDAGGAAPGRIEVTGSLLLLTGFAIRGRYSLTQSGRQIDLMILFIHQNLPDLFRHGVFA